MHCLILWDLADTMELSDLRRGMSSVQTVTTDG